MSEKHAKLSALLRMSLIVSAIGYCLMGTILWGTAINAFDVLWYVNADLWPMLLFFGVGLLLFLVFSLLLTWEVLKHSRLIGIGGIITFLLMLSGAAIFLVYVPLVFADSASLGWFGLIWTINGTAQLTVSPTWPFWWVWAFWAISYICYIIELMIIAAKLVPTSTNN